MNARTLIALCAVCFSTVSFAQPVPELPPLTESPSANLPGKFVWADLFTTEVDEAIAFYTSLFDLEWQELSGAPDRYGILLHEGYPVAGIAWREPPEGYSDYGRWVHYLSVRNVDAALDTLVERGGWTLLPARTAAQRGRFAIGAGPDGEVIGFIRSSSGDPVDYRSESGEWLWRELLSPDAAAAATTYGAICNCPVLEREDRPGSYLVASQDYLRAGITPLDPDGGEAPIWLGFVRVGDVGAATARARQLGATIRIEPTSAVMDGDLSIVIDPVGAAIALVSWDYEGSP